MWKEKGIMAKRQFTYKQNNQIFQFSSAGNGLSAHTSWALISLMCQNDAGPICTMKTW